MSPTDVKISESNILRGTRGNLNEAAADAAGMVLRVGLRRGAGSPLVAVPPVPWGHTHLQKLCRGPGVVGRVHGPSPAPQTNGFPWVGQLSPPPQTRMPYLHRVRPPHQPLPHLLSLSGPVPTHPEPSAALPWSPQPLRPCTPSRHIPPQPPSTHTAHAGPATPRRCCPPLSHPPGSQQPIAPRGPAGEPG